MPKQTKQSLTTLKVGETVTGEVVEIYAAVRKQDRMEGRGVNIDESYHLTHRDALIATTGIDAMGTDGKAESRLALWLSDGRYFLVPEPITLSDDVEARVKAREQALAKLSLAERAALLGDN